jgi:probable 2-oxoglutarate dehydrogenase E1 component DHKTD1
LPSELDPATYGIKTADTQKIPLVGLISISGKTEATIKEIIEHLRASYTSVVGVETTFASVEEQEWIAEQMEKRYHEKLAGLTAQDRAKILTTLAKPELFNQFMQKKYPTVKRYSGEGNEASILAFGKRKLK